MRLTKIICTLGPSSSSIEELTLLADTGMNIARINMSHGTKDDYANFIQSIRTINEGRNSPIGIMLDTKGAEIRTGDVKTPIEIAEGQEVIFSSHDVPNSKCTVIGVNYDGFKEDVQETDRILIDNGELSFSIQKVQEDGIVIAKAQQSGSIGSRRHINLPGADVDLPSITKKDWEDIEFAIEQDVDFLALSFIRNKNDINLVRKQLDLKGSSIQIITKVETRQAVANIQEVIDASDGIMVARGDLGAEVPFDELPSIQDDIVLQCNNVGKPVIIATHMLESMRDHPIPTRAEVTDVAHAAMSRTDATMLSGETASGKHPSVALHAMHKILDTTENNLFAVEPADIADAHTDIEAQCSAAVTLAHSIDADALLVFTKSGKTALGISKFRPSIPVVACTPNKKVQQQLSISYAIQALFIDFGESEETVQAGLQAAKDAGLFTSGMKVVLIADANAKNAPVSSVQVREIS